MDEEKYLIDCELENQKFIGISCIKKYIYTMSDKDFLVYYYDKCIKECIKDKFNNFDEFKKKYKNKKDIEKLRIELINIETKHIEDFKLINY
jgi:hypothetical protein